MVPWWVEALIFNALIMTLPFPAVDVWRPITDLTLGMIDTVRAESLPQEGVCLDQRLCVC